MRKTIDSVWTLAILILLTFVIFNGFGIKILYLVSGIILMGLSGFYYFSNHKINLRNGIDVSVALWMLYHIIAAFVSLTPSSVYVCIQHIGIILFFWMIVNAEYSKLDTEMIEKYCILLHVFTLTYLLFITIRNPGDSTRESYIYIGLATMTILIARQKHMVFVKTAVLSILWALISYIIGARAQAVSFLLFLVLYIVVGYVRRKGISFPSILFYLYYTVLNLFPLFYTWLANSQYRLRLEYFALQITGSRFFSGRDVLWNSVYSNSNSFLSRLFGLGFAWTSQFVRSNISLHNLYVTTFSEGGIVFVVLLGVLLCSVWKKLNSNNSKLSMIAIVFMMVFLYKQSFDVSLTENNLWVAFPAWMVLGLGVTKNDIEGDK